MNDHVCHTLTEPPIAETEEVVIDHQDWEEDVAMSDNAPVRYVTDATITLQNEPTSEKVEPNIEVKTVPIISTNLQPRDGPLTDLQVWQLAQSQ